MLSWTEDDIDRFTRTVWGEARGDSVMAWVAIAHVITSRAEIGKAHPHFGDGTLSGACLAPMQFSCWNSDDPNRAKMQALSVTDPAYIAIRAICMAVLRGVIPDPTGGATYYYAKGISVPFWARGKEPCYRTDAEYFFRNVA